VGLLEEFWRGREELDPLRFQRKLVHVVHDAIDLRGDLTHTSAEGRIRRNELPEDGVGIGLSSMEDRILQGEFSRGFQAHIRPNRPRL
jgi:hypothetical protein